LLAVAVSMLSRSDDEVSLEAIAKEAGVGIGTLYRHFPTREALVAEAYASEIGLMCAAAAGLLDTLPADVALREWMQWFVDYVAAKRGVADALQAVVDGGPGGLAGIRHRITAALATLVGAGQDAGTIRDDIDPEDVLGALRGVWMAAGVRHRPGRARRLLNLLMDGLRPVAGAAFPGDAAR
jgi:AcrR family transcriptional regulator